MLNNQIVLKQAELCGRQFAVYGTPENPLFKAQDVASIIGHSNISVMLSLVDNDEKGVKQLLTPGGNQQVWMLTEDGLYEILMQSRKPIAKQFKKEVKKILHDVRTTGGYIAAKQDESPEVIMARALQIANETIERNKQQLQIAQGTIDRQAEQLRISAPKVAYVDEVLQSQNTYNVNLIAKELGMSAETLNRKLKEMGVQYKQGGVWVLAHKYQNRGYTKTRTSSYTRSDGSVGTSMLTVFTEKGRAFIHSLFLGK